MNRLASLIVVLFYGWIITVLQVFAILRLGRKYFTVRKRETPPTCLLDPGLGKHCYVKLKDVKLHYVVNGDPRMPLMLLIHGFPEFWFSWRHQLREFSKDYCVVAVDMRGFGDSEKPRNVQDYLASRVVDDMHCLIQKIKDENSQAVVIAHDWGGIIAYQLAAKYPQSVSKLIVGNAPHMKAFQEIVDSSWKQFLMSWYVYFFQLPYLPEFVLRSNDLQVLEKAFANGRHKVCNDDEVEAYKFIYSKPGAFTAPLNYYRANFNSISKSSNDAFRVTVPTLLIWGDKDSALHMQTATASSKYVDNFNLRVIEGISHWVQMEAAETFNGLVRNFLNQ